MWSDPYLEPYARELGTDRSTDIDVLSQGFKLQVDPTSTVVGVTLFNDENALGFPDSGSNYSAFSGVLPLGLSWADTAASVQSRYPGYEISGGYGTEIILGYLESGYRIDVALLATHADQMPGSPLHSITIAQLTTSQE